MNEIQKLFTKYGFDLENDNNASELCDAIVARIRDKSHTQETSFDGKVYCSTLDRINHLKDRIIKEQD